MASRGSCATWRPNRRGESVGAAADVYALGATLDALLGGRPNGPASFEESGNAREAAALGRGLSLPVCALIRSCLTRDARFRPSAADVAARAGVLASQMLGTDGRSALRAWLEPIRARVGHIGALDDLMGLCLVPVGGEGARTFTFSRVQRTPPARGRRRRPTAERSRKPLVAALMMTAAFGATAFAWQTVRYSRAQTRAVSRRVVDLAPAGATPTLAARSAAARPPAASPARPVALAQDQGWLRVGGATLVGGRVEIDGAFVGFAPIELSLPFGSHVILVTSDAGRLLVRKRFRLAEAQTRLAPLRVLR